MDLSGKNFIGSNLSQEGGKTFSAKNPATGQELEPLFHEASESEIDRALTLAEKAFEEYRKQPPEKIAAFLERIADEIIGLGDELIQRANAETALPEARLTAERARTVGQIKMFAALVREGSWVEARIDRAMPDRKPIPKPDLRRKLVPIGPVVVFGASNFPFAFSVPGGDTASALAAGNPVVVKAHPAHPGTSELIARAILAAAKASQMPEGVFSMVHGVSHEVGLRLVRQAAAKAVSFTGSLKAGRALFDAAAARPEPIPVYAEMGSTNPIFILPGALKQNGNGIAEGLLQSVTLGVGQFCTNPGLVFGLGDKGLESFIEKAGQAAVSSPPGTMLYQGICERYHEGVERTRNIPGVRVVGQSAAAGNAGQASAMVLATDSKTFLQHEALSEELFGPSTLIVSCGSANELERIAKDLPGQLTATIHGTEDDLRAHRGLVSILEQKVGRLLFNGFSTGVEVCPSMHHGGPYPATTDAHFTSVGGAAIIRFARPICFQNFPDSSLPIELRNKNERGIWRLVDGEMTKGDV
jgi:NADP-dependent aldehyde dehydrogenase